MLEQLSEFTREGFSLNTLGILLALIALETCLSADNAVALAVLVQQIEDREHQHKALNWGLLAAVVLRITLLVTATWVIKFWQFALAGAIYLLWLATNYFWQRFETNDNEVDTEIGFLFGNRPTALLQVVPLIALTDLAFSLDSVTTAVALSSQIWLILVGCLIGVIALRFLTGLFVQWLAKFTYLQDAAYLTVFGVGMRLLLKVLFPDYAIPDWMVLIAIAALFAWGFSKRVLPEVQ